MFEPLTDAELDELEALERKAHEAPWRVIEFSDETACIMNEHVGITDRPCRFGPPPQGEVPSADDARLIVAIRNAAPRLLAELRRLRADLAAARDAHIAYVATSDAGRLAAENERLRAELAKR